MSSAIDQEGVKDLSSWDSAGKIQSITPKAPEPPRADTKGKNWDAFKGCVCLGKQTFTVVVEQLHSWQSSSTTCRHAEETIICLNQDEN